jgi:hypothetical protein
MPGRRRLMAMKRLVLLFFIGLPGINGAAPVTADAYRSKGRGTDSTAKTLGEIRDAERRRVPIEVFLQTDGEYSRNDGVEVTVIITNLFDQALLLNRRLLVNHPKLSGEVSFRIADADGNRYEIQRLVTPMKVGDDDFILLPKGQSVQRTVDLSDIYGLQRKGVYKLQAYYHNNVDHVNGTRRAWKGLAASEPTEITLR